MTNSSHMRNTTNLIDFKFDHDLKFFEAAHEQNRGITIERMRRFASRPLAAVTEKNAHQWKNKETVPTLKN
ncbi:hypothetical protein D3C76_1818910 [compost metagenome]